MITITCFLEACIETPLFRTPERVTLLLDNKYLNPNIVGLCIEPCRITNDAHWIIGYSDLKRSYSRAVKNNIPAQHVREFKWKLDEFDGDAVILATNIEFVENDEYKKVLLKLLGKHNAALRSEIAAKQRDLKELEEAYVEISTELNISRKSNEHK